MSKALSNWLRRFLDGLRLMTRPAWVFIAVVLNIFTTSSIVTLTTDIGGKIPAIVTGISLVIIVAIVTLQAPYRGQLEITRQREHELEELNDYAALRQKHLSDPHDYIWIELEQLIVTHGGADGGLTLRCQMRSALMKAHRINDVQGYLLIPMNGLNVQHRVTFRLRPGDSHPIGGLLDTPEGGRCEILLDGMELEIAKKLRDSQVRRIVVEGRLDVSLSEWASPVPKGVGRQIEIIIDRPLT